ncbi:transcriptional regulator, Nlp family [Methylophilus rhizosphaerae]|uniref:Transcriptional regulator, Nlp family n=1 Tax=Methylophilus rhizosphaerae TaxID=492660 RepID=A0A1G9CRE7_9PROT|nr:helix-turn-helix transcriptional regulator [Methylophilus rhizosphaerae]SDK54179.1 transcriptional regulator, Nlp family [Methylophilus rhizosphaerae]
MPKKPASSDWHRADVIAAFKKRDTSITRVAREKGMNNSYLLGALNKPYPKAERMLAEFLGVTPQTIWPSRYHADGSPKSGRGERGLGRHPSNLAKNSQNSTPSTVNGNVNANPKVK